MGPFPVITMAFTWRTRGHKTPVFRGRTVIESRGILLGHWKITGFNSSNFWGDNVKTIMSKSSSLQKWMA
jgi:hypothetical protein